MWIFSSAVCFLRVADLTNESLSVLASFFSRLGLVLGVLDHVRSFPEAILCLC